MYNKLYHPYNIYSPVYTLKEIRIYVEIINIIYKNFLEMFPKEESNFILKHKIKNINKSSKSLFIFTQTNKRKVMYKFYDILHTMYVFIDLFIKTRSILKNRELDTDFDYSILFNDYDNKLCKSTKHLFIKLQN